MKTKNVVYTFLFVILMHSVDSKAWDTTAAKFYPLSVGNVYVFVNNDLYFSCLYPVFITKHKVEIQNFVQKQNGKWYYKFNGWWPQWSSQSMYWNFQRIDSNTMNVYGYDSVTNTEVFLDSLKGGLHDTFKCQRFNGVIPFGRIDGIDSVKTFGMTRIRKMLQCSNILIVSTYFDLLEGIGFTGYSVCEAGGGGEFKLAGCIISGTLYGDTTLTRVKQLSSIVPDKFTLSQNYPNPFNPKTVIRYSLIENRFASLKVFNIIGNEVTVLVNQKQNAGNYEVEFDGNVLPSGVYFYKFEAGDFVETKRMILLK